MFKKINVLFDRIKTVAWPQLQRGEALILWNAVTFVEDDVSGDVYEAMGDRNDGLTLSIN